MQRLVLFALGVTAIASLLLRSTTGCSNNPVGNPDAGDGGFVSLECGGGCLCFPVDACPAGCYRSQTAQTIGAAPATFCSNGIVTCAPGGRAWSVGAPLNNCPIGRSIYVDGGPDGAFCCTNAPEVADADADARLDLGTAACAAAGGQCGYNGDAGCTIVGPEQACNSDQPGGSFCCAVAPDASCKDGGIRASSYNQSCTIDPDCIAIAEGDSCSLCGFNCPNTAINVGDYGHYLADIAYTPAEISGQRQACSDICPLRGAPCCVGGQCQQCSVVVVHPDAAMDAGAE